MLVNFIVLGFLSVMVAFYLWNRKQKPDTSGDSVSPVDLGAGDRRDKK